MRAVNASCDPPLLVRAGVLPKMAVPVKDPIMMLEPFARAETPLAESSPVPPTLGGPGVGAIGVDLCREGVD